MIFTFIIYLQLFSGILCWNNESNITFTPDEFKCALPDITTLDLNLNVTRFKAEFSKISEVKFPGLIGPLNEKLICKIKCIDGNWVGPLCSTTPDGRFQPVLRECAYNTTHSFLSIAYKNSTIDKPTLFPHGSTVSARCRAFGLYKLKGDASVSCKNGEWVPKFPTCVPTNLVTNFSGDAPPTILFTVVSGSAVVHRSGELAAFPDSTLRIDCLSPRPLGTPEWTWTQSHGQHQTAWSEDNSEKNTHYRLTLSKMSTRHSDHFTCTSPDGHTNTIAVKVVNVTCKPQNVSSPHLAVFSEGCRLGQSNRFSCDTGNHLEGDAITTCMADGEWSSTPPKCVETTCPTLKLSDSQLNLVEYNSSIGGRAMFQCGWGYKLIGMPGLECEQDGHWSGDMPQCLPVYCPKPPIPENGKILSSSSPPAEKYPVGDLIFYKCNEGFEVSGELSIVCTENGFWSHPPPFCLKPAEIRKGDTIFLENTTLIYSEE